MMDFADALILVLMFSQWSLISLSCTKDFCSCSSGFLWHLIISLIYRKSVHQALHPYAVVSIQYLFSFLGEYVPLLTLFGGPVSCIIIIDSFLGFIIWYKIIFHIGLPVWNTDINFFLICIMTWKKEGWCPYFPFFTSSSSTSKHLAKGTGIRKSIEKLLVLDALKWAD